MQRMSVRWSQRWWGESGAALRVCPELLTHVKEETEKEASLAKNFRKAKEEREAARKNKGAKAKEDP